MLIVLKQWNIFHKAEVGDFPVSFPQTGINRIVQRAKYGGNFKSQKI